MKNLLNYYGTLSLGQGYSGSIEQNIIALDRRPDVDVRVMAFNKVPVGNVSDVGIDIKRKPFQVADVGLVHGFPATFDSNLSKFRVGFTMFETDTLPTGAAWVGKNGTAAERINGLCDLLIVPCHWNIEVFRNAGVTIPIEVVGNGVVPEQFPFIDRSNRPKDHVFTYFMHGTLTLRKNPGMVISAFANLFKDNPNVRLVLKTQSGTLGHVDYVDMGRIEVIDELWSVDEVLQAMADADCYVFPSRGEGFGMPPIEAMATGLPTIIGANSGMLEYADPRYNIAIPTKEMKPALRYPRKWGYVGNWHEPDYYALKEAMLWVYEHQEEAAEMGKRASNYVHQEWNYDVIADKIVKAIKKHYKGWQ